MGSIEYDNYVWVAALTTGILSVASSCFIVGLHRAIPSLGTFPARLNFWLVSVDLVWFATAVASIIMTAATNWAPSGWCAVLGPVYHGASLASVGTFVIIALNLAGMVRQEPVPDLEARAAAMMRVVVGVAAVVPLALVPGNLGADYTGTGSPVYISTAYGTCFVTPRLPGVRFALQTLPALVAAVAASAIYGGAAYSVTPAVHGSQARSVRARIVRRGAAYVAGFALCWWAAVWEDVWLLGAVSQLDKGDERVSGVVEYAKAVMFLGQGVWNATVFIVNKWPRIRPEAPRLWCVAQTLVPLGDAVGALCGGHGGAARAAQGGYGSAGVTILSPDRPPPPRPGPTREHSLAAHLPISSSSSARVELAFSSGSDSDDDDGGDGDGAPLVAPAIATPDAAAGHRGTRGSSLGSGLRSETSGSQPASSQGLAASATRDRLDTLGTFASLGDAFDSPTTASPLERQQ